MTRGTWRCGAIGLMMSFLGGGIVLGGDDTADRDAFRSLAEASRSTQQHDILKNLNGKWTTVIKWWLRPGADPVEIEGRSVFQWILERRFMAEESKDHRFDSAYFGKCFLGYDSAAKEYTMVRMDVLGTDLRASRGTADASGKSITFHGSYVHPVTGKSIQTRTVLTLDRKNRMFEMFETPPDGDEYESMQIQYKRVRRSGA